MAADHDEREIDPEEFLRAMLRISPEDAAEVRDDAARCRSVHGSNHRCELRAGHKGVHAARLGSGDQVRWTHNLT